MNDDAKLLGWIVVANVSDHIRGGQEPGKFYQGTKRFSPGTRVYLGDAYWGMGGEHVQICGLRRVSRKFVSCTVHVCTLVNLRTHAVYSPSLIRKVTKHHGLVHPDQDTAQAILSRYMRAWRSYGPDKLRLVKKNGPWGIGEFAKYRPFQK